MKSYHTRTLSLIAALALVLSVSFATEAPKVTPTPTPIVDLQPKLDAAQKQIADAMQALGLIREQRAQLSTQLYDTSAQLQMTNDSLTKASARISELEKELAALKAEKK